ncbi:MAG: PepSY domain-containing protein [Chloroflexota bacterium]
MSQKTALWVAAALTAFILVLGGAVAGRANQAQQAAGAIPTVDIETLILQREAKYKALLDQANAQLAEAYNSAQTTAAQQVAAQPATVPTPGWISAEEAMSAAVISVPGAKVLRQPELVDFQGTVAYEVRLDKGTVYIDASNGALLYDGTARQSVASSQSPASETRHGDGDDHDEHDDDHDEHDDD